MGRLLGKISLPGRRRQACARRYLTTLAAPLLLSSEAWRHDACAAGEKHQLSALKFEAVDRSLMDCSLLASGLFLKVEIKSMTKNVWNQGFAELQTLPVSTARLGGFGHSAWAQGHSGWQSCQPVYARRVGLSGSPAVSPELCK